MKTVKFICARCGEPGEITFEPTGDEAIDEFLVQFAKMLSHDKCVPETKTESETKLKKQLSLPETRATHPDP